MRGQQPARPLVGARVTLRRAVTTVVAAAAVSMAGVTVFAQAQSQEAERPQPPPAGQSTRPSAKPPQRPSARKSAPPQAAAAWRGRGFAVVSAGAQLAAPGYASTSVYTVHAEDATLTADASIGIGPAFGARGGVRVWKNVALGGGLEIVTASQDLAVTGRIPHPFQFNQSREVEGTADGLERVEALVALEVSWYVALARRVDMFVFGGPAYINVRQDMATRIRFTESYPYDTVTFTGIETASVSGGGFGVTGGIDIAFLLSKRVGIGGELRYSHASTTLTPLEQPSAVALGGLQVALGARILF